jgi:hypothetical protein
MMPKSHNSGRYHIKGNFSSILSKGFTMDYFKTFKHQFILFCKTSGVESQKSSSYYKAIQYLAEYLGFSDINGDNAKIILAKEKEVKDKTCSFYKALLRDLELKGRKSYLEKGFMSAAFPFFRRFLLNNNEDVSKKSTEKSEEQQMSSFQTIFFGAPGTGKSHKIDYNLFKDKDGNLIGKGIKEIPEDRKFRTTFHPDYDYVQFVGAYKPQKVQCNDNGLLSEEQLAHKLSESFLKRDNSEIDKTSAIVLFGLQYANSLNGKTISQIVKLSGIGDEEYKKANLSAAVKAQLQFSNVDGKITYSFVPQVFAKAYATAWKQYFDAGSVSTVENQVYLVIEEINRGNCAQIFGDIFQLLDRVSDGSDKGFSQYSIDADYDFADWLKNKDAGLKSVWNQYKDEVGEGKLRLPPNLNILATMNTSDQSLFPMDSAFKRRFDWEYVPISFDGKDATNYQIDIDGFQYSWQNFVEAVNDKILDLTESEDKQLGEFFIKPDSGNIISKERFLGKVMFYLWNEVCKDEHKNGSFFRVKNDGKEEFFTFQDLYKKKDLLKLFMDELLKKE